MMQHLREHFMERLEDPSLLDAAVEIEGDLAVPVGGKRRGGFIALPSIAACKRAVRVLKQRGGFPNLRIIPGDDEVADNVCWGGPAPGLGSDDLAWGRYYGYSEQAIAAYCSSLLLWQIVADNGTAGVLTVNTLEAWRSSEQWSDSPPPGEPAS